MEVVGIWRYPVKSLGGEQLETADLVETGLVGDRQWAVADQATGRVLSAKRDGRLLDGSARLDGGPMVELPGGGRLQGPGPATDAALSSWLGRSVRLVEAGPTPPTFERQADDEDDSSPTATWAGRPHSFVDSSPLHLLTTASLRAAAEQRPDLDWAPQRFRPNLLIDAVGSHRVEDDWIGQHLVVGDAEIEVTGACRRCVMTTRAAPGLDRQPDILRHLVGATAGALGVRAAVVRGGTVRVGDPVRLRRHRR